MANKRKIVGIEDVLDWVDAKLGTTSECVQRFRGTLKEQEYNGSSLPALDNKERLAELGVDKMGIQDQIVLAIKKLKSGSEYFLFVV